MRTFLAILLCGSLAGVAGCTRTSDGTVHIKPLPLPAMPTLKPIKFGQWPSFRRRQAEPETLTQFPTAPQQATVAAEPRKVSAPQKRTVRKPVRQKPPRRAQRVAATAPAAAPAKAETAKPLSCRNETQPGGRVKVVCE